MGWIILDEPELLDPRTTTPVEGTHYQFAANFGQPPNNLAYQTPRTFRNPYKMVSMIRRQEA